MNIGMAHVAFGGAKGIARAAAELASGLASHGHNIDFHCVDAASSNSHIQFRKVRAFDSFNSLGILSFAFQGKRSLERFHYDVTHSHGGIIGSDVITAHSCHKAGMRVERSSGFGIADRIRLHMERRNYGGRRFKKIIAVSEGVKRELAQEYGVPGGDVVVIPNGVNIDEFSPRLRENERASVRRRHGIAEDDIVLIFVANEFVRKGLEVAISGLALLRRANVKLLILGGDERIFFEEQARKLGVEKRVHFVGTVARVSEYYAASDLFILPTSYEAFSLASLEAAASGLPLIMTKVSGAEELIRNGENGVFVERDADDIAETLRRLVDDVTYRHSLGTNARATATQYSWDIIAQRTLSLYSEITK